MSHNDGGDFDRNTSEAIQEIYKIFNFSKWSFFTFNDFMRTFNEINEYLWDKFNHGRIDRLELRNNRFGLILDKLGVNKGEIPDGIGDKYLELAPVKPNVIHCTTRS